LTRTLFGLLYLLIRKVALKIVWRIHLALHNNRVLLLRGFVKLFLLSNSLLLQSSLFLLLHRGLLLKVGERVIDFRLLEVGAGVAVCPTVKKGCCVCRLILLLNCLV